MNQIMLPVEPDYNRQTFSLDLQPDDHAATYSVEIIYRPYVGKYFMTIVNASTGKDVLRNFPIIASEEDNLNDLLKQVAYKLCGSLVCYPLQKDLTKRDPDGTISEFELVWGDSLWQN